MDQKKIDTRYMFWGSAWAGTQDYLADLINRIFDGDEEAWKELVEFDDYVNLRRGGDADVRPRKEAGTGAGGT